MSRPIQRESTAETETTIDPAIYRSLLCALPVVRALYNISGIMHLDSILRPHDGLNEVKPIALRGSERWLLLPLDHPATLLHLPGASPQRGRGILIPSARSAADMTVDCGLVWQKSFTVLAACANSLRSTTVLRTVAL